MYGKVFSYPRETYDRAEAWWNLLNQKIPGCPDPGKNPWRKRHSLTHWCWEYAYAGV